MEPLNAHRLRGLWVPIVTPFTRPGAVDAASLRRLAGQLLDEGATGLVALGTTGEPATLSLSERRTVVEVCAEVCAAYGRALIVGAGTNSTAGTSEEISHLCASPAVGAALVVVPYYTRPSMGAVVEHFHLVADRSPVPVVLYNIPYRTGRALDAHALADAAAHPGVIGLKQAVGCLDADTLALLGGAHRDFAVLAGDDAFIAPTVLLGGAGAIAAAAHLCTDRFAELVGAALDGRVDRARTLANALLPVVQAGFAEPNPAVWKGALHRLGRIADPGLRRPLTAASDHAVDKLLDEAARVPVRSAP